jgi:hypothetical protein
MGLYSRFSLLSRTRRSAILCGAALLFSVLSPFGLMPARAAQLTSVMVEMNNMNASAATIGTVCAKPATTSTSTVKTYQVTFAGNGTGGSASYAVSSTAANWQTANISTTSNPFWPAGATAWPNATAATATISTNAVTWTNTSAQTMTSGTWYCFNWTSSAALTQPTSANSSLVGSVSTCNNTTCGPATNTIDTGQYATASLTATTGNNFVVNATVNPNFSFSISQTSTTLTPNLDPTHEATDVTPTTSTLSTNANNGWFVWGSDSFSGLKSATAVYTINVSGHAVPPNTASTSTTGSDYFITGVTSTQTGGSGTITVATPFVGSLHHGSAFDHTTQDLVASSNGTANNAVLTYTNYADVGSITPSATDYTDTITLYAAGSF